jgi:hypothetical protein
VKDETGNTYTHAEAEYMLRYRRAFERQRALENWQRMCLGALGATAERAAELHHYSQYLDREAAEAQLALDMFNHDHRGTGFPVFFPDDIANAISPDAPMWDI